MRRAGKNKELITKEIKTFIHEVYGTPTEDDFSTWISTPAISRQCTVLQ
jgi:hypothetical protein